ncbi:flagellar capping protein [Clostridium puniceum]|uniref:Flagellar hook-associated protein 2 n=1 Tax=Clostridium puniceum TaxID=29367 RepID=A0A1S8TJY1_9CLOT|nr:flagellar filament capping protein FliD [Clostridium puniceum]OOM77924.1 flagellar capping protein [Clostridium puniceum]
MTNRMTGISGLIDTDSLVKATMLPYKTKVETQKQKEQVLEWKQEQYRAIMKSANSLYTKYLTSDGSSSLISSSAYSSVKFTSSDSTAAAATTNGNATIDNYTIYVKQLATNATATLSDSTTTANTDQTIKIGASTITFKAGATGSETVSNYNTAVSKRISDLKNLTTRTAAEQTELNDLNNNVITAKYNTIDKGVVFTAAKAETGGFTLTNNSGTSTSATDKALDAEIVNSKGNRYRISATENTSYKNEVTIDGVTFNFKNVTGAVDGTGADAGKLTGGTPVTLTGGKDVTALKTRIVAFMKDYNELMGSINTKLYETRDKSYSPLTDDQRSEMTDDQITKWETKAKTGLLRKDDTLEDLAEGMKSAMTGIFGNSLISSSGITLEKIGITPIKDYTTQNGMYEVDEEALTKALEENFDGIKEMFIKNASSDDTSNSGIIPKLTKVLYDNVKKSDSVFKKLAGDENGVSSLTSDLSKQITEMKKKIAEMEDALTDRENRLYTKYSSLESALTKMQSQQDSLASYFTSS